MEEKEEEGGAGAKLAAADAQASQLAPGLSTP